MDSDKVRGFLIVYFALIVPAALMVLAAITNAGVLWFFLLMIWMCAGLMIAILPSSPDTRDQQ